MGAITKIAIFVIVVWGVMEFQTKGIEGAFGGFFAPEITNPIEHTASAPQRAKKVTERAFQKTEERRNRMLGE